MTFLFAWVVPAYVSGSPVDHTWVTTYDSRVVPYPTIEAVVEARQNNWYCWGDFHPKGGTPANPTGFIGSQGCNPALASCLVQPNVPSSGHPAAQGTIFTYGIDGVCHQLANQVLYSTKTATTEPLTVKEARGYAISSFIYGTYGLQHAAWQRKLATCTGQKLVLATTPGEQDMHEELPDDFEKLARETLADKPDVLNRLMGLRGQVQTFAMVATPGRLAPSTEYLNARNQHLIDQAAALLDADDFRKLFGIEPGEKINLVDPTIQR